MKEYLIGIHGLRKDNVHIYEQITIYGDTPSRPFIISHNLWNYATPEHAAQRLEKIAKAWEANEVVVTRIYGTIDDMPTRGDNFNIAMTVKEWGGENFKSELERHKELYGY